jgi:GT2 family glycosyltransferase
MKLSIIIVSYNVKYLLEQCLNSVLKATQQIEIEVFVVDNDSSDNTIDYLQPKFPQVRFIANQENVGFSTANNQAIALAEGEYILLLNPDTVIGENTLMRVCEFMDKHPEGGGLGVKMIDAFGRFLPESKRGFPSLWNSFCKMSGLLALFPHTQLFGQYHLRYLNEDELHEVPVLAGAFMLLRKSVLDKIGWLDESFFMYGEDIDLSYRIQQGGYKNFYFPEPIIHYKGESTKKDFKYVRIFYNAMLIFYDKHYANAGWVHKRLVHLAVNASACIAAIAKIFPRKFSPKTNKEQLFDISEKTYEEIIFSLDKKKNAD